MLSGRSGQLGVSAMLRVTGPKIDREFVSKQWEVERIVKGRKKSGNCAKSTLASRTASGRSGSHGKRVRAPVEVVNRCDDAGVWVRTEVVTSVKVTSLSNKRAMRNRVHLVT